MADLIVKDVALRLGDNEILKGVSLAVPAGEVVALLGPSGSGKTTLLRAVAGLETPHRGSIAIGNNVFFDAARGIELPAEQRGLGLVFQSYALWPHRTVFDNVAYGLKLRNVSAAEIKTRVEKTLSQIGLGHLAARYPHQLSGGQQQRVAIARALVYEPPVILLDEPLSNLDAKLREEARAWLRTLIVTLGLSAIHVTHDQVEAMAIADRVGQQQRVAIARALVYEPPVILLDEPLSNLDAKLREEARAWLRTLIVTLGLSAIHVTHDQVEAMAIADRVVLLDAGVIAQEGPPTALYNDPATLFAAEFMGSNNRLDGKLVDNAGGRATIEMFGERLTGISRTKAAIGSKVTGIIRIERVHCASSAGPNRLKMELKAPMYLGERWELVFARESLTVRAYASAPLGPGEHYVEFPPETLWVF